LGNGKDGGESLLQKLFGDLPATVYRMSRECLLNEIQSVGSQERHRRYLEIEPDAAAMYSVIARVERDQRKADVFRKLGDAGMGHARLWAEKLGLDPDGLVPASVGCKLRLFQFVSFVLGTSRVVPWLIRSEFRKLRIYASDPEAGGDSLTRGEAMLES